MKKSKPKAQPEQASQSRSQKAKDIPASDEAPFDGAQPTPEQTVGDLYQSLQFVAPALAKKELVPQLVSFAFNKGAVIAYNDLFAAETDTAIDFNGCVRGAELLQFLGSVPASAGLDIAVKGDAATFKCGKAQIKLPVDGKKFPFAMPSPGDNTLSLELGESLSKALGKVMVSAQQSGVLTGVSAVVLRPQDGLIFATDNLTISVAHGLDFGKGVKKLPESIGIPAAFCAVLLAAQGEGTSTLHLGLKAGAAGSEGVLVALKNGTLFCKTVPERELFDAMPHADRLDADSKGYGWFTLPEGFVDAIKRCQILSKNECVFTNDGTKMVLSAESPVGKFRQTFEVKRKGKFEPFTIAVDPKLVTRSVDFAEDMCLTPGALLLGADGYNSYIAAHSQE
jgi:hypothetical protein